MNYNNISKHKYVLGVYKTNGCVLLNHANPICEIFDIDDNAISLNFKTRCTTQNTHVYSV